MARGLQYMGGGAAFTTSLVGDPAETIPQIPAGVAGQFETLGKSGGEFFENPSLRSGLDVVESAANIALMGKGVKSVAEGKVEVGSKGKEGAYLKLGDPNGTQLSFNAYFNNAAIADIGPVTIPGLGINIQSIGKRIRGIEFHRFVGKGTKNPANPNGTSILRLHRHSPSANQTLPNPASPSQISKHRMPFSDETY